MNRGKRREDIFLTDKSRSMQNAGQLSGVY
jgi:hypothetical protein